ncbi:MAG: aminotransferase class I/II-fold pyridoxal phosphate-dependent enzyme [Paenibacillaceae bacterium]
MKKVSNKRLESKRLDQLGSAIFAEVEEWKLEARALDKDIIDLGIGSPDLSPSPMIVQALQLAVGNSANYHYPSSEGSIEFRTKAAEWLNWRFGVEVDPVYEILTLMGTQDGLAHLTLAICDPGDIALLPDPGYPIYAGGLALAGVEPYYMPLRSENDYLPRLDLIPADIANRAKFMLLNYPSNPLASIADLTFFEEVVQYGRKHDLLIVHDLAYCEMAFEGFRPPSILSISGAMDIAVEFHSLSKSFNMAGCRIGFMAGRSDVVQALRRLKSNIDYGVFKAVQAAGIVALEEDMKSEGSSVADIYERRRDIFLEQIMLAGWNIPVPKPLATMFVWVPIPVGWTSRQISREILLETGVVVIPGDAFGQEGEGFVRIALVQEEARLIEAARRIGSWYDIWSRGFDEVAMD